jgi:hypothetical protein
MKLSELIQKTTLPAPLGWVKASARRMLLELRLTVLRERLPELSDAEVARLLDVTRPFVPHAPWANDNIVKGLHQLVRNLSGSLELRVRMNGKDADVDPLSLRSELEEMLGSDDEVPRASFDAGAWQTALRTTAGAAALAHTMATHVRRTISPGPRHAHDWTTASLGMVADILEACHSRLLEFSPVGSDSAELSFLGAKPLVNPAKIRGARPSCGFCGKAQQDVRKLICGPGVYICNECVELCNRLVAEDQNGRA